MNLTKKVILMFLALSLSACVNNEFNKSRYSKDKKFYSANGFALIYEDSLFEDGVVNRKLNNEKILVMHSSLNINTFVKIVNPENSIMVETKVFRKAKYPKLFNIVVSKKIAQILKLDVNNPYIEILEVKKNKTFVAKESNIFEEEKKVAETAPVDKVEMDDLSTSKTPVKNNSKTESNFIIVINDFYYYDSANNLKQELLRKTQINNFLVKKINNNKYRLLIGPFKNFDALKSSYISLNNLGFEELNIYKE